MMESLGDILKKRTTGKNIPGRSTDTWSSIDSGEDSSPDSTCPICEGAGFVHPLSASGRPDFSRVVPCRCRYEELKKEKLVQLQRYSNLGALSRLTFDNLRPDGRHDEAVSQQ